MSLRNLKEQKENLENELYELHFVELNPDMYMSRRSDLEYQIACLEEQIEFEEKMKPFRETLMIFVIISLIMVAYLVLFKD